jgi:hypothetical protein
MGAASVREANSEVDDTDPGSEAHQSGMLKISLRLFLQLSIPGADSPRHLRFAHETLPSSSQCA